MPHSGKSTFCFYVFFSLTGVNKQHKERALPSGTVSILLFFPPPSILFSAHSAERDCCLEAAAFVPPQHLCSVPGQIEYGPWSGFHLTRPPRAGQEGWGQADVSRSLHPSTKGRSVTSGYRMSDTLRDAVPILSQYIFYFLKNNNIFT